MDYDESGSGLGLFIVVCIVVKLGGNLIYIDGLNGGGFGVYVMLLLLV